jgi:hypothetical protein
MTSSRRRREKLAKFALALASLVVTLAVREGVLRTTHLFGARISWSTPDTLIAYRFVPGSHYWYNQENDHPIVGTINRYGWRDRDWALRKRPGVHRVAVLGDSFVEAFQVESDSTFLRHAERLLANDFGIQVETMNFARSGCTQSEELLILENAVTMFEPDLAVLCFLPGNDISEVRKETALNHERPFYVESAEGELTLDTRFRNDRNHRLKVAIDPVKRRSALVSLLAERYTIYRAARLQRKKTAPPGVATSARIGGFLSVCTESPDPRFVDSYRLNKILIAAAAERGVPLLLVCMNSIGYISEAEQELRSIDSSFDAFYFEKDLRAFAATIGIDYLGLQTPFRQASDRGKQLHWVHWNYNGHRVAGDAMTAALVSALRGNRLNR